MNSTGFNITLMPKSVTCYICGRGYGTKSIGIHLKNCEKKWDIDQMQKPPKERRPCPQPPKNFLNVIGKDTISRKDLEQLNNKAFEEYNEVALERCNFCNRTFNPESFKIHQRLCSAENPFKPLKNKVNDTNKIELPKVNSKIQALNKVDSNKNIPNKNVGNHKTLAMVSNYVYNPISGNQTNTKIDEKKTQPKMQVSPIYEDKLENNFDDQLGSNELAPCSKCGRSFAVDRISKHEQVCKENSKPKKDKVFHKKANVENKPPKEDRQKWKEQHEAIVASMKYMRQVKKVEEEGGDVRKITPPPSMNYEKDYKECIHCGRKFNEPAFERHSKVCMNIVNKPAPLMRKNVNYGSLNGKKVR